MPLEQSGKAVRAIDGKSGNLPSRRSSWVGNSHKDAEHQFLATTALAMSTPFWRASFVVDLHAVDGRV